MNILQLSSSFTPFNRITFSNQANTNRNHSNHDMLYQCSSSRFVRIPLTTSQLPRTTAHRSRASRHWSVRHRSNRPHEARQHSLVTVWSCLSAGEPASKVSNLCHANNYIHIYIYDIYNDIYIYRLCEIFMSVTDTHFQSCPVVFETVMPKQSWVR